jgi:exocyst complex component 3
MSSKVQHLDHLLTTDQSHPLGPCGPSLNLLVIHHGIQGLEGFRNETLFSAKLGQRGSTSAAGGRGEEEKKILLKWFERLDDLIKRYEEWLWAIAGNMLDTVREGNGGVIVRLIKIVEFEGREDDKVSRRRRKGLCGSDGCGVGWQVDDRHADGFPRRR